MNTSEMVARLNELKPGMKIEMTAGYNTGKVFIIRSVKNTGSKQNVTYITMIEEGLPETYTKIGRWGEAAGKALEFSNITSTVWYAQKPYMNWKVIE